MSLRLEKAKMAGTDHFSDIVRAALQFLGKDCLSLHPQQQEVLLHILSGRVTFINPATGFRKSLIFELMPLSFDCQRNNTPGKPEGAHRISSNFQALISDLTERGLKAAQVSNRTEASVPLNELSLHAVRVTRSYGTSDRPSTQG